MASQDELLNLDATAQAELVRKGEVKPIELVDAAIARIEEVNPALNAVVTPMFDQAREAASAPNIPDGPFKGVPFLEKDIGAACAGVRHTFGSVFLKDHIAPEDAKIVVSHRRAGLMILGRTNTAEFGFGLVTEPVLFGATRNPWNLERTPGGSSGGSAAAVAAGMVAMAYGNDLGGSIRIPASCCGLFGLKPTRARTPVFGTGLAAVEHAVTRSVRDSAALLDATAGFSPGEPFCAPPLDRPLLEEVGAEPGQLRIALISDLPPGQILHEDCKKAVLDAAALCESLGHVVEEAHPVLDGERIAKAFPLVGSARLASLIDGMAILTGREATADQFEPLTWAWAERGRSFTATQYLLAGAGLEAEVQKVVRFMVDYDVILTPTLAEPPVPLGTFHASAEEPLAVLPRFRQFNPFAPFVNIAGNPAMSVPLYWSDEGLPIGTQFIGRFGDEATLFRLAAQLEAARPWGHRRPIPAG